MHLLRVAGLLAALVLIINGCGIIAPDARLDVYQDDESVGRVILSPSESQAIIQIVNVGEMRAKFSASLTNITVPEGSFVEGAKNWVTLAKKPTTPYLDPEERAELMLDYSCAAAGTYRAQIKVEYEKQIGQPFASFIRDVILECPALELEFRKGSSRNVESVSFGFGAADASVELHNGGLSDITVTFESSSPAVSVMPGVDGQYTIEAGMGHRVEFAFACDGMSDSLASLITVLVDGEVVPGLVLAIEVTDCPVDPEADPASDLVFMLSGGRLGNSAGFDVNTSPVLVLANVGLVGIEFELVSSRPEIVIGEGASNVRELGPGRSLNVPLTFVCGAETAAFSGELAVMVDGVAVLTVEIDVSGCEPVAPPVYRDLVQFTHDDHQIEQLNLKDDAEGSIIIYLENLSDDWIGFFLEPTEEWLSVDTVSSGRWRVAGGSSRQIILNYDCTAYALGDPDPRAALRVIFDADGSHLDLPIVHSGCDLDSRDNLRILIDGVEATEAQIHAKANLADFAITFENTGRDKIELASVKLIIDPLSPVDWIWKGDFSGGAITVYPDNPETRALEFECLGAGSYVANLEITFADTGSGSVPPVAIPIRLYGCQ